MPEQNVVVSPYAAALEQNAAVLLHTALARAEGASFVKHLGINPRKLKAEMEQLNGLIPKDELEYNERLMQALEGVLDDLG